MIQHELREKEESIRVENALNEVKERIKVEH